MLRHSSLGIATHRQIGLGVDCLAHEPLVGSVDTRLNERVLKGAASDVASSPANHHQRRVVLPRMILIRCHVGLISEDVIDVRVEIAL